jgi:hypothetical protein
MVSLKNYDAYIVDLSQLLALAARVESAKTLYKALWPSEKVCVTLPTFKPAQSSPHSPRA